MAELTALRPLLETDPAATYLVDELAESGHAETALEWLTGALDAILERTRTQQHASEDAQDEAAAMIYGLTQRRHNLREELGLTHDEYDNLADRLRAASNHALDALDDGPATLLFWPQAEFTALLLRWPTLADTYPVSWDEHRAQSERALVDASGSAAPTWSGRRRGRRPGGLRRTHRQRPHQRGNPRRVRRQSRRGGRDSLATRPQRRLLVRIRCQVQEVLPSALARLTVPRFAPPATIDLFTAVAIGRSSWMWGLGDVVGAWFAGRPTENLELSGSPWSSGVASASRCSTWPASPSFWTYPIRSSCDSGGSGPLRAPAGRWAGRGANARFVGY
ncbi:hypothetical protein NKG94_47995 [Micromonospora sp. M12]